jgi:peptide/nickel transport system substrate-binding protein
MREIQIQQAIDGALSGRLSRRQFMRRAAALGMSATAVSAVLAACGSTAQTSAPAASAQQGGATASGASGGLSNPYPVTGPQASGSGGTLIIGQESDMDVLDPALGTGAVTWRACLYQIYESLAARQLNSPSGIRGTIVPGITDSIDQSPDGKTYTFHLHPGITFSDGTPFDGDAVKWNVERQWDQTSLGRQNAPQFDQSAAAVRSWFWTPSHLQNIVVVDPHTVRFELGQPFAEFVGGMIESGLGTMGITSPAVWQKGGNAAIAAQVVGTGPFLFKERVEGDHVTIVKNPNYWNPAQAAKADSIIFKVLGDDAARVEALRSGDVHAIFAPPPSEIASLRQAGFIVTARLNPHLWYLSLNAKEPYWQDVKVRQAFWMSIDRDGMAQQLLKGTAFGAINMQGPTAPSYSRSVMYPAYDPAKAKQLLSQTKYANGFETVFQIPTGGSGELIPVQMAEWIAANAAKIGIKISLQTMEWISYLHAWGGGLQPGIGMNQQSWGMTSPYWLNLPLRNTSGFNVGHSVIQGMDQMLDAADESLTASTEDAHYQAADSLNGQALWSLPIVNSLQPTAISPKVMNWVQSPDWWWDFRNVWVKG